MANSKKKKEEIIVQKYKSNEAPAKAFSFTFGTFPNVVKIRETF